MTGRLKRTALLEAATKRAKEDPRPAADSPPVVHLLQAAKRLEPAGEETQAARPQLADFGTQAE